MTYLKYLSPILAEVFRKHSNLASAISVSKELLREAVQAEVLAVIIRFMTGLILTSIIVFSLVVVGRQVNHLILAMSNGAYVSIGIFSGVAIVCAGALVWLFKTRPTPRAAHVPLEGSAPAIDLQKIVITFLDGIVEGVEHAQATAPQEPVKEGREAIPREAHEAISPRESSTPLPTVH